MCVDVLLTWVTGKEKGQERKNNKSRCSRTGNKTYNKALDGRKHPSPPRFQIALSPGIQTSVGERPPFLCKASTWPLVLGLGCAALTGAAHVLCMFQRRRKEILVKSMGCGSWESCQDGLVLGVKCVPRKEDGGNHSLLPTQRQDSGWTEMHFGCRNNNVQILSLESDGSRGKGRFTQMTWETFLKICKLCSGRLAYI